MVGAVLALAVAHTLMAQAGGWSGSLGVGPELSGLNAGNTFPKRSLSARAMVGYRPDRLPFALRLGADFFRFRPTASQTTNRIEAWEIGTLMAGISFTMTSGRIRPYVVLDAGFGLVHRVAQERVGGIFVAPGPFVERRETYVSQAFSGGIGLESDLLGIPLFAEARLVGMNLRGEGSAFGGFAPLVVGFRF